MKALRDFVPMVAAILIVPTYLLVRGTAPDVRLHELTLDALRTIVLQSAALERDVLRARTGLLRSYDPLVRAIDELKQAAAHLRAAGEIADADERSLIDHKVDEVANAIGEQEALLETFKSKNALLQNSLKYFTFLSGRLAADSDHFRAAAREDLGAVTTAMLTFMSDPGPGEARRAAAALDQLGHRWIALTEDLRSILVHGRLIIRTFPAVDELVARLQAAPTNDLARSLQDTYLDAHGRATARSGMFRTLLYVAALVLGIYVTYLFIRLRSNAGILRQRLAFEDLIGTVSTQFINLPHDHIHAGIGEGLAQLARYAGLDSAQIIACRSGKFDASRSHQWRSPTAKLPSAASEDLFELALTWRPGEHECHGCTYVPNVRALAEGPVKATLRSHNVRSWLRIPMQCAGEHLGYLTLGSGQQLEWREDDIAQLRTAADIFANAMAREANEAEREELQARLNRSQRLEAIGTLAGGIAHEFNNILGAILGYGEMALAALHGRSPARGHIRQMMRAGERAQDVVEQVLAFGRQRERRHRQIRAEPVVAEAIGLVRASFPPTLTVHARLRAAEAAIMGDATELQQVVMNLSTNAAHAMDGKGTVEVELDEVEVDGELALSHGELTSGGYVRLAVRDSGHGIDPSTMERIFEPFFTTKPVGQGTGLGLSTVYGIVVEHGGALHVESRPRDGTKFEAYFPRMEAPDIEEEGPAEAQVGRGRGETILLVEDDRRLMLLGEEMLAALGYEGVGFDHAPTALAAFRADPQRFDLVLTDEVMPEMTGTELAGALRDTRPDLPVVLMSGYDHPLQSHRLQAAGIQEVLKKPLRSAELTECLAKHLSEHATPQVDASRNSRL